MVCTNCGTENLDDASHCTNCNFPIERKLQGEDRTVYCPRCGTSNPGNTSYCSNCGVELVSAHVTSEPAYGSSLGDSPKDGVRIPPKDLGVLVRESFRIYQDGIGVYVTLGLISQVPFLTEEIVSPPTAVAVLLQIAGSLLSSIVVWAIMAKATWQYIGYDSTVGRCLGRVLDRFWTLLIATIMLVAVLTIFGFLSLLLIGIPLFFWFLVSRLFIDVVIVVETASPMEAFSRSAALVKNSWWRVFGIVIAFALIIVIPSLLAGAVASIATAIGNQPEIIIDIVALVAVGILVPVFHIGTTLVYFDLRSRKEGLTLEELQREMGGVAVTGSFANTESFE